MNQDVIKKTQSLAKLGLKKDRFEKISKNIADILGYIDIIKNAETSGLADSFNASGLTNVSAEDKPVKADHLTQKQVLKNAKRSHNGFVQVEKVI